MLTDWIFVEYSSEAMLDFEKKVRSEGDFTRNNTLTFVEGYLTTINY